MLAALFDLPALADDVREEVEITARYDGYIRKQEEQIARMERLESRRIPAEFDYAAVTSLRLEAAEKLSAVRPRSIGQASRISGVSPADISVLLVYLERARRTSYFQIKRKSLSAADRLFLSGTMFVFESQEKNLKTLRSTRPF